MTEPSPFSQTEFPFADEVGKPSLVLGDNGKAPLRPSQVAFNKALKSLQKTREHLERQKSVSEDNHERFQKFILPAQIEFTRARLEWIFSACDFLKDPKNGLGPVQRQKFLDVILTAREEIELEGEGCTWEELEELCQRVDELLGPEVEEEEDDGDSSGEDDDNRTVMEKAEQMLRGQGLDIDLAGLEPNDFDTISARIRAAMEKAAKKKAGKRAAKHTAAAKERERKAREKEQAKLRDFKSLFKSLAKAMHPDLVIEPEAKEHREQWMKRLTAAYEKKDLHAMLTIEMEWLGTESKDLEAASDEKLKMYTRLLREQTRELEFELHSLLHADPLYYFNLSRGLGTVSPEIAAGRLRNEARFFSEDAAILKAGGKDAKKLVVERLRELRSASPAFYL